MNALGGKEPSVHSVAGGGREVGIAEDSERGWLEA